LVSAAVEACSCTSSGKGSRSRTCLNMQSNKLPDGHHSTGLLPGIREGCRGFGKLADALAFRRRLVEAGAHPPDQLGVFAKDLSSAGAKLWLVDSFLGFARAAAPPMPAAEAGGPITGAAPRHLYEVLPEDRPCWLYFDIEFARATNPHVEPGEVASAFRSVLNDFCADMLGAPLDQDWVFESDSTTSEKFSRHMVAKRLQSGPQSAPKPAINLALRSNAQAGLLVSKFIEYARGRLAKDPSCTARFLFLRGANTGKEATSDLLPIVDASVYSRHRCFRVLFSSKLGKKVALSPLWDGLPVAEACVQQVLESLASFVPDSVELLQHALIPPDWCHRQLSTRKSDDSHPARGSVPGAFEKGMVCATPSWLLHHLVETWDQVRTFHEHASFSTSGPTRVQSVVGRGDGDRYLAAKLARNRFCFCKGASHKSNQIYLVVDCARNCFYQKCHDIDCQGFRSDEFPLPKQLQEEGLAQHQKRRLDEKDQAAARAMSPERSCRKQQQQQQQQQHLSPAPVTPSQTNGCLHGHCTMSPLPPQSRSCRFQAAKRMHSELDQDSKDTKFARLPA